MNMRLLSPLLLLVGCSHDKDRVYTECVRSHTMILPISGYNAALKMATVTLQTTTVCDRREVRVDWQGRTYFLGPEVPK